MMNPIDVQPVHERRLTELELERTLAPWHDATPVTTARTAREALALALLALALRLAPTIQRAQPDSPARMQPAR